MNARGSVLLFLGLGLALIAGVCRAAEENEPAVSAIFAELRSLKSMEPGARYTLPVGSEIRSGPKEEFLRRRTAFEISESGLSCGCGDVAVLFIDHIRRRGFEALLVDSAQLSLQSLLHTFAGHAVVAIRPGDAPAASWWLVDPTARTILSRDWSPDTRSFTASGHVYWIGYCGPLERYPVRSPAELKRFYAETLATVPSEVLNRTLTRFIFTIDASLEDSHGRLLNPRVAQLRTLQDEALTRYRLAPKHEIAIHLTRGSDDATSHLRLVDQRWIARIGLRSACSPSLLTYFDQKVRHASPSHAP